MERTAMSGSVVGLGRAPVLKRAFAVSRRHARKLAVPRVASETSVSPKTTDVEEGMDKIYIGKGRYVMDDPKKYPKKENAGDLFQGISGGWAGGEIGLKAFTAELVEAQEKADETAETAKETEVVNTQFDGRDVVAQKMGEGEDTMYVGFSPRSSEDLKARREGAMGKFIVDDARKYPSKDAYGIFGELAGGFAGGEKGLKQFVEKGDIEFVDPPSRQWSPIVIASLVAGTGSLGVILFTRVFDLSEGIVKNQDVLKSAMDDRTKLLFEVAIGFLAVAWIGSTAFATFKALRENLSISARGATNVLISVAFWTLVLVAAYQIAQT